MTARGPERIVREWKETHMTCAELADLCVVGPNSIREACQSGKVQAVKHGRSWLIPRLDGLVYARAYLKQNTGETWTPVVERKVRAFRPTNPTRPQSIKLDMPAHLLAAIDAERERRFKLTGRRQGNKRSNLIFEAIERWLID